MRNISMLSGFSILAVILNHATWHIMSRFVDGAGFGYPYLVLDQIGKFAVSSFIFISGYFIAYMTNGGKREIRWDVILTRVTALLWPWLFWSLAFTVIQSFSGEPLTLSQLGYNLFVQYYFIPLLMLCYLVSIFIIRGIYANLKGVIIATAVIQSAALVIFYLRVYSPAFPDTWRVLFDSARFVPFSLLIFFVGGLIYGCKGSLVKVKLVRIQPYSLWIMLACFAIQCGEAAFAYHLGGGRWPIGGDQVKLSSLLFSSSVILFLVCRERIAIPRQQDLLKLGSHTFGIYLSHYILLGFYRRLFTLVIQLPPSLGIIQIIVETTLTVLTFMAIIGIITKFRWKWVHQYIFP